MKISCETLHAHNPTRESYTFVSCRTRLRFSGKCEQR